MGSEPPHDDLTGQRAGQLRLRHDSAAEHAAGIGLEHHARGMSAHFAMPGRDLIPTSRATRNGIYDFDLVRASTAAHLGPRTSAGPRARGLPRCRTAVEHVRAQARPNPGGRAYWGVDPDRAALAGRRLFLQLRPAASTISSASWCFERLPRRSSVPQPTVKEVESADMAVANLVTTLP